MEKTIQFGEKFKPVDIIISDDKQKETNQIYINDLINLKKHRTTAPTIGTGAITDLVPKKFIDQIQFYFNGSDYRVYFFINNTWKYIDLT